MTEIAAMFERNINKQVVRRDRQDVETSYRIFGLSDKQGVMKNGEKQPYLVLAREGDVNTVITIHPQVAYKLIHDRYAARMHLVDEPAVETVVQQQPVEAESQQVDEVEQGVHVDVTVAADHVVHVDVAPVGDVAVDVDVHVAAQDPQPEVEVQPAEQLVEQVADAQPVEQPVVEQADDQQSDVRPMEQVAAPVEAVEQVADAQPVEEVQSEQSVADQPVVEQVAAPVEDVQPVAEVQAVEQVEDAQPVVEVQSEQPVAEVQAVAPQAEQPVVAQAVGPRPSKKVRAIAIVRAGWAANHSRKDIIAQLIEQLGMSTAGASTYYQNIKSGAWD